MHAVWGAKAYKLELLIGHGQYQMLILIFI
jgi:hypothetical protein